MSKPSSGPIMEVIVIDDDGEIRTSIAQLLRSVSIPVRLFHSAQHFLDSSYDLALGSCLIVDVRMPGPSGLKLQELLTERDYCPPFILLTAYPEVPMAVEAMKNGAFDFFQKPFAPQALLQRVQEALAQDSRERELRAMESQIEERLASLSPRERQVTDLLVAGRATKEIAFELGIRETTVDFHRRNLFEKMGVENAIVLARVIEIHRKISS